MVTERCIAMESVSMTLIPKQTKGMNRKEEEKNFRTDHRDLVHGPIGPFAFLTINKSKSHFTC